jgi:hypothetical protein
MCYSIAVIDCSLARTARSPVLPIQAACHTTNKYSHAIDTYLGQPLAEFFFTNLQVHS